VSTITEEDVNARVARRVRDLRARRGLTLGALAARSGVSRSMISLVERGEASPTAVVLEKLATGLDVPLAGLFEPPEPAAGGPLARVADQPSWRDPASGYVRRNVSPAGHDAPVRIVAVEFPAGQRVAYETGARETRVRQQVWLLAGEIEVTVGPDTYRLAAGDCLAYDVDQPVMFHNPGDVPARYAAVLHTQARP
jgi:transcriptional regulator with XRE-family HTH domain